MKQEHLQVIEKSIFNDQARLQEVDNQKEIENIDKMLDIFKNYETELVNLNLELLKPYLEDNPDVFVTLEFIQCLLLGNKNNQLNFELDEEQRGLLVWICKMLETKKQELTLAPKLSSEERYQIEQRLKTNQETYDILLNHSDTYLSAFMITNLASTVPLTKEELYLFYQDLIERNNQIYLREKNNNLNKIKVPDITLTETPKEVNELENNLKIDDATENITESEDEKIDSNENLEDYLSQIDEESDIEEFLTEEEINGENKEYENEEFTDDVIEENIVEQNNQEYSDNQLDILKQNTLEKEETINENLKKEPSILKKSFQILEDYNLNNQLDDDIFNEEPILQKLKNKTKEKIKNENLQEHTKEILTELKENDFMKISDYLLDDLIIYSSKPIIETVFKIANQENISKRILEQIPSVFLENKANQEQNNYGNFKNFVNNIKILKENNIDITKVVKNSLAVLTLDSNKLIKNIQIAKLYKIPFISKSNHEEYNFLLANDLASAIDKYIEVGLEIYVKEKTAKLINPDNIMFYRLYYANQKHLQYICQFEKDNSYIWLDKEINNKNGFGITNENYLEKTMTLELPKQDIYEQIIQSSDNKIDSSILDHPFIKELEQYRFNNQNYYQINSIKISRIKVLRIFSNLINHDIPTKDALLYAVLYNTILNEKQFSTLRQAVDEICEEKVI